jgi:MoxR-like ATPase
LSQLTKKELLDLAKEVRKEKRFMNKANKVIPEAQRIISEMISRANNLKGNKDLKDVAKNDTVKESVADIVAALEDASDELNSHGISGNVNDIIDTLKNGESKIKSQIESGNYKKEELSKPQTTQSTNIEEKLTSLDNDDEFDVK